MQLVHCGITWLLWSIDDGLIPRQLLFEILARVTVVRHRHVWIKSHLWTVLFQALSSSSWTIIVHESIPLFARHIKLLDLRKKLLQEHERLGLIRNYSESHFEDISIEDVKVMLTMHGEALNQTPVNLFWDKSSKQSHNTAPKSVAWPFWNVTGSA